MVATETSANSIPLRDLQALDTLLEEFRGRKDAAISILQRAQDLFGYLPREILHAIAERTHIPLSQLYGVATFYGQFRLKRHGRHLVRLCDGTACHVRGANKNLDEVQKKLAVEPGATTADDKLTLEIVYCLGSCGLAPVVLVDDKVHGRLTSNELISRLEKLP